MSNSISHPLWHKEGNNKPIGIPSPAVERIKEFLAGEDAGWDTILLPYDIKASRAHARGLLTADILTGEELQSIEEALSGLHDQWESGAIRVTAEDEDCHTVIEHHLVLALGDTGKKIHTGRSRNDQVLAALRLYISEKLELLADGVHSLVDGLCDLAETNEGVFLPGYTHFQRAMPSTVALWALGYAELLCDDMHVLAFAKHQIETSPLGSAAGYGVPYVDLPRKEIANNLGFSRIQHHVTSVQLSRGKFELNAVHAMVQVAMTINRLASDLVMYYGPEYSFIKLPDELTTGSSIMPQKRNPDVLELARASFHRISSEMNVLLSLSANLPSGYHRDLQLTKEATMRATEKTTELVAVIGSVIPWIEFDADVLGQARTPDLFATAFANKCVQEKMPFRDAYRLATKNMDEWKTLSSESLNQMYRGSGQPGTENPGLVREKARDARSKGR